MPQRVGALVDHRARPLREQRRAALRVPASTSSATTTTSPSQQLRDLVIRNNLFTDIDHRIWGGAGIFLQIGDRAGRRPRRAQHGDAERQHHLGLRRHAERAARRTGFRFASNIVRHNTYGIVGDGVGIGNPAIASYFPRSVIIGNAIAGGNANLYPAGNTFPTVVNLMAQFESPATDDYRLVQSSNLRSLVQGVTGVDFDEMQRAMTAPSVGPRAPTGLPNRELTRGAAGADGESTARRARHDASSSRLSLIL